jgi:hypothetical protein
MKKFFKISKKSLKFQYLLKIFYLNIILKINHLFFLKAKVFEKRYILQYYSLFIINFILLFFSLFLCYTLNS